MSAKVDENAIIAAVRAAESRTSGQIVCVLARRSCDPSAFVVLYAAALALITPWPLLQWTQTPAQVVFAIQTGVFVIALLLLGWTRLGVLLTPRTLKRRQAFAAALEQFFTRSLGKTRSRAGVLIYVSQAEHYARIIADRALDDRISEKDWRGAVEEMTAHLREGRVTEGFVDAVARCGDLLARAAPPDGGGNDLPDNLIRLN
ncbi:TPM domain-containing protein [Rhodoblastus sp.]|uniref:TPM domain-containing protein n=1 Tax=Rhodoblastus sp. TaxID=1962975 RepID=UPI003F995AB4